MKLIFDETTNDNSYAVQTFLSMSHLFIPVDTFTFYIDANFILRQIYDECI